MHKQERKRSDFWSLGGRLEQCSGGGSVYVAVYLTYEKQLCKDASYLHLFRRVSQPYICVILSCLQSMELVHFNRGRFLNLG